MAEMKGTRIMHLSAKNLTVNFNELMIQYIVDGLVENRKNIEERQLDLYDSMVMDMLEQLEGQGVAFPDLILGDEPTHEKEHARIKELIEQSFNAVKELTDQLRLHYRMNMTKVEILSGVQNNISEICARLYGPDLTYKLTGFLYDPEDLESPDSPE